MSPRKEESMTNWNALLECTDDGMNSSLFCSHLMATLQGQQQGTTGMLQTAEIRAEGRTEAWCSQQQGSVGEDHCPGSFCSWTLGGHGVRRHPSNEGRNITPGGHRTGKDAG